MTNADLNTLVTRMKLYKLMMYLSFVTLFDGIIIVSHYGKRLIMHFVPLYCLAFLHHINSFEFEEIILG